VSLKKSAFSFRGDPVASRTWDARLGGEIKRGVREVVINYYVIGLIKKLKWV
jgi:hypothetical protein